MLNKILNFTDKFLNFVMIIFCLLLVLIGGYAIYDSYQIYDKTELDDTILTLKPKHDGNFNFEELRKINPDVEGWINIFGTTIDYPVLHSHNNLDYLDKDYKGNYATGGSIFSDYRNQIGFSDDYTILYGHNMTTGQMFSDIRNYVDDDYFKQHLYGSLYTEDHIYKIEVLFLANMNAYHDNVYDLITYANGRNEELAKLFDEKARQKNISSNYGKLVLLSTCDSYGSNDRTALLVSLADSDENELKITEEEINNKLESEKKFSNEIKTHLLDKKNLASLIIIVILIIIAIILGKKIYIQYKKSKKGIDE